MDKIIKYYLKEIENRVKSTYYGVVKVREIDHNVMKKDRDALMY